MSALPDCRPPQAVRTQGTGDDRFPVEQRYQLLVNAVRDYAIFMLDSEGRVETWNVGAERLKGYRAEEIIGQHFSRFSAPEDRAAGKPERELAIARDAGKYEEEGWRVRKDGTRFWANVVITAIRDGDGALRGFAKVTHDMTERKELVERVQAHAMQAETRSTELERLASALREANSAMESFAYSVSHDLRAPLRAMWGFAEALEEDYREKLDEQGRRYTKLVMDAARRMDELIEDLLAYSRLSRTEMELAPVDLEATVREVVHEVCTGDRRCMKSITVAAPLPSVIAHHPTLVQMLSNLLSNALKFVPPGTRPQVRVFAELRDSRIRLWVEDNGLGIAPEHQTRIFLPFERLHGPGPYPGTGIGLAIVRKGVERMGGTAGVDSELGRGSRFWIELPAAREDE
jgi:PAS domain S-box-containing protein